ncbi:hypothetical protein METHPM2_160014 [Pseudomonas sp. PM2]
MPPIRVAWLLLKEKRGQIYFPETHSSYLKGLVNPINNLPPFLQAMTKASSEGRRFCNKQIKQHRRDLVLSEVYAKQLLVNFRRT